MDTQAPSPDAKFRSLVLAIQSGARVDMAEIAGILAVSGRSHADLVSSLVSRSQSAQPGDTCDCGGRVGVYCTRRVGGRKIQYLKCTACGAKPANNKRTTI
ncbi:MAG: hypothetical protein ACOX1P_11010 [Thermoguttaceae bacterium]|jgi:hypothetical protein